MTSESIADCWTPSKHVPPEAMRLPSTSISGAPAYPG